MSLIFVIFVTLLVSPLYASIFEWTLHRYLMHKPVPGFRYPYETHATIHHKLFRADKSYHVQREEDKEKIPMAWWNGPVLVCIGAIPYILAALVVGKYLGLAEAWAVVVVGVVQGAIYYAAYEYLHWCMHLPRSRRIEKSSLFRRINGHHVLHHRAMSKNFNVVLPFADLLFGTLLVRAKKPFDQVRGPAVPDVQPLLARS